MLHEEEYSLAVLILAAVFLVLVSSKVIVVRERFVVAKLTDQRPSDNRCH